LIVSLTAHARKDRNTDTLLYGNTPPQTQTAGIKKTRRVGRAGGVEGDVENGEPRLGHPYLRRSSTGRLSQIRITCNATAPPRWPFHSLRTRLPSRLNPGSRRLPCKSQRAQHALLARALRRGTRHLEFLAPDHSHSALFNFKRTTNPNHHHSTDTAPHPVGALL
jgi:hypothetical protein